MSYRERQRLADIHAAIDAIRSHLKRGGLSDGLVFDAVRIRLLEIGEAVKALPDDLLASQPSIPWRQITRMRDHLAHRYFDTAHAILQATIDEDLPDLERAVLALSHSLADQRRPACGRWSRVSGRGGRCGVIGRGCRPAVHWLSTSTSMRAELRSAAMSSASASLAPSCSSASSLARVIAVAAQSSMLLAADR